MYMHTYTSEHQQHMYLNTAWGSMSLYISCYFAPVVQFCTEYTVDKTYMYIDTLVNINITYTVLFHRIFLIENVYHANMYIPC